MGKEFEIFLIRQQQMVDAHRVQMEIPKPTHAIVPDHAQELANEEKIKELRKHIAELRGEFPKVIKIATQMRQDLQKHGRIFDRHDL